MMTPEVTLKEKARVLANSFVTWATAAAFAVSVLLYGLQATALPDGVLSVALQWGGSAAAFLTAAAAIVKRHTPVPESGLPVIEGEGGVGHVSTLKRGWK